jgi:CTP:molybdopterin cytidylyltransferase MocA
VRVAGLVLAAGEGRRIGAPKALVRDADDTAWVVRVVRTLAAAGIDHVLVVVGAAAEEVRGVLASEGAQVVHAHDWGEGMGASLSAGLRRMADMADPTGTPDVDAALVCVVDTPDLDVEVVRRVAATAAPDALARATYDGVPGHPVVIGRQHFAGVLHSAAGDVGARAYLSAHAAREVECGDLSRGTDVDTVDDLPPGHRLG